MSLLVLSYPNLKEVDFNTIQKYRKNHDKLYYSVVKPHFTLVFPVDDLSTEIFIKEVLKQTKDCKKINFTMRDAIVNKDSFNDYYHTFLVPDEGNSLIIKLHDKLYSDQLKSKLRFDIDYIPHIGIGNSKDPFRCQHIADDWNKKEFEITGSISHLSIVNYENNVVTLLDEIILS